MNRLRINLATLLCKIAARIYPGETVQGLMTRRPELEAATDTKIMGQGVTRATITNPTITSDTIGTVTMTKGYDKSK